MTDAARAARRAGCFLLALLVGACAPSDLDRGEEPSQSETAEQGWSGEKMDMAASDVEQGRRIAEDKCASCHAIDRVSQSPRPGAPPLRDVLGLYEADNLGYRFIEGMRVGHDDMPVFDFDVRTTDMLIAYMASINAQDDASDEPT